MTGSDILAAIEGHLDEPSARGLAHAVSRAIRDGGLAPGTKLPPIREVATQLALSPTTVSAGWALLIRAGNISTDGRRGTTVCDTRDASARRYQQALDHQTAFVHDLSTGVPDAELLPKLDRALAQLKTAGTPSSYLEAPVLPELATLLLEQWPCAATDLAVVDGAMDALELVARTTLTFGDRVVVEHPCFPPLIDLLESVGVELVGVPMDDSGLELTALTSALETRPVAVFLQPRAQNPTGISMTRDRGRQLAAALRGTDIIVVEDDSADGISTSPAVSLGEWIPEQTVHVRSFSKAYGPDLRLAAMTGPARIMSAVAERRALGQGWSSRLLQRILLSLLSDPAAQASVRQARDEYARRRSALVTALASRSVDVRGTDGINIWVPVEDESAALIRLASQGIGVTPGRPFAVGPELPPHIRVTVGLVRDGIDELAAQLAAAAHAPSWGSRGR